MYSMYELIQQDRGSTPRTSTNNTNGRVLALIVEGSKYVKCYTIYKRQCK